MRLEKITGPACKRCGCQQSEEVGQKEWFGALLSYRRCRNCLLTWATPLPQINDTALDVPPPSAGSPRQEHGVVQYEANPVRCRCPKCQADNPPVKKTIPRDGGGAVRYHKCGCGHTFKSMESR